MSSLFIDWAHVLKPTPYSFWENDKILNKDYENEKKELNTDPYLALYWLLHFGFSLDKRYEEVKSIVMQNQLQSRLLYIDEALSFFAFTDPIFDIPIASGYGRKEGLEQIFLKRRCYLVYHTQSQSYRGGANNFENWWHSITIYPHIEKYMPFRMRWLRNNLKKFDSWQKLDDQLSNYNGPEISLMSYALACHPNRADRIAQANKFLREVWENKNLWKETTQQRFLRVMIWDVHQHATDIEQLAHSADFYFKNATLDEMYLDIQKVLGTENKNIQEISIAKEQLMTIFSTDVDEESLYEKVADFLDTLKPELLFTLAKNIEDHSLNKYLFRYLFLKRIPHKKEVLIHLFIRIEISDYNVISIFKNDFPQLLNDAKDPNLEIAKAFMTLSEADFRNDYVWEKSKAAACMFFINVAHEPAVFDFLMEIILHFDSRDFGSLKKSIFSALLQENYECKINPVVRFSKEQVETMLETVCAYLRKSVQYKHESLIDEQYEAVRVISHCENIQATEWLEEHNNKEVWLKTFTGNIGYDSMQDEIQDAIESALEDKKYYEINTDLRKWENGRFHYAILRFYQDGFTIYSGDFSDKLNSESFEYSSFDKAKKKALKQIDKMLQNAYKRF